MKNLARNLIGLGAGIAVFLVGVFILYDVLSYFFNPMNFR
jgi:divalent metal cation (Fe/Co/Zn/Cd) transporter